MKRRRSHFPKDPIKFLCIIISISCTLILFLSLLKLHNLPLSTHSKFTYSSNLSNGVGKLGEMVIQMLPQDLSFTIFLPSDKSFNRDLGLSPNDLLTEKMNDTYVILTRILGFSTVPRSIKLVDLVDNELNYDSISGYTLFISKHGGSNLIVNGIVSKMVDLRRNGNVVVHVMDGVIMDSEFEQSVKPSIDEDDD